MHKNINLLLFINIIKKSIQKMSESESDCMSEFSMSQETKSTYNSKSPENENLDIQTQLNGLSNQKMANIFSNEKNIENEYENENEDNLYYVIKATKEESTKSIENENNSTQKKPIFSIVATEKNKLTKKKRGRQTVKKPEENRKNKKTHDKSSTDNLLRKIQVHYMSFIISFINAILKELNYNQRFLKINYQFKKNVNKDFFESLKIKNLSDIINNSISDKYKKKIKNLNYIIYDEIKDDPIINNILNENYLDIFKNYYYKSVNIINLAKYGIEKEINLPSNVKMYKDFIKEIIKEDKEYAHNLNICISQNYLTGNMFMNY
jgi:uncharacterized protein YktA (UPF0223 family)